MSVGLRYGIGTKLDKLGGVLAGIEATRAAILAARAAKARRAAMTVRQAQKAEQFAATTATARGAAPAASPLTAVGREQAIARQVARTRTAPPAAAPALTARQQKILAIRRGRGLQTKGYTGVNKPGAVSNVAKFRPGARPAPVKPATPAAVKPAPTPGSNPAPVKPAPTPDAKPEINPVWPALAVGGVAGAALTNQSKYAMPMSELRKKAMQGLTMPKPPSMAGIATSVPMPQKASALTAPSVPKVAFDLEAISTLLMDGEKAAGEILFRCSS